MRLSRSKFMFFVAAVFLSPAVHAENTMAFALPRAEYHDKARIEAVRRAATMRSWELVEESHEELVLQITTEFRQRHAKIRVQLTDGEMIVELIAYENLGKRKVSKDYGRWIDLLYADTLAWLNYI